MSCISNHKVQKIGAMSGIDQKLDINTNKHIFELAKSILKMAAEESDETTKDIIFRRLYVFRDLVKPRELYNDFFRGYINDKNNKVDLYILKRACSDFNVRVGERLSEDFDKNTIKDFVKNNLSTSMIDVFLMDEVDDVIKTSSTYENRLGDKVMSNKWDTPYLLYRILEKYGDRLKPYEVMTAIENSFSLYNNMIDKKGWKESKIENGLIDVNELFHKAKSMIGKENGRERSERANTLAVLYARITRHAQTAGSGHSSLMKRNLIQFVTEFDLKTQLFSLMKTANIGSGELFDYSAIISEENKTSLPSQDMRNQLLRYARKPSIDKIAKYDKQFLLNNVENQLNSPSALMTDREFGQIIYQYSKNSTADEYDKDIISKINKQDSSVKLTSVWSGLKFASSTNGNRRVFNHLFDTNNSILEDKTASSRTKKGAIKAFVKMAETNSLGFQSRLQKIGKDNLVVLREELRRGNKVIWKENSIRQIDELLEKVKTL